MHLDAYFFMITLGGMTADEFAVALRRLNLSQAALAREIDVHRMTIWKYTHGQLAIPKLLQRYLELRLELLEQKW